MYYIHTSFQSLERTIEFINDSHPDWDIVNIHYAGQMIVVIYRLIQPTQHL